MCFQFNFPSAHSFILLNTCTFISIDIVKRKEEIREHLNIVVFTTYTYSVHGRKQNHKNNYVHLLSLKLSVKIVTISVIGHSGTSFTQMYLLF